MKPPKFHVGQAVVCVHDDWRVPPSGCPTTPKKNGIYTVAEIKFDKAWDAKWYEFWKRKYFIRLSELPGHWFFTASYFAPVELLPAEALAALLAETLELQPT